MDEKQMASWRRVAWKTAIALLVVPVRYPLVEEGRHRQPQGVREVALFALLMSIGAVALWWSQSKR